MNLEKEPKNVSTTGQERKKEISAFWFSPSITASHHIQNHNHHEDKLPSVISAAYSPEFLKCWGTNIMEYIFNGDEEKVKEITGFTIIELENARKKMEGKYRNKEIKWVESKIRGDAYLGV